MSQNTQDAQHQDLLGRYVIVCTAHGHTEVHPATVEMAMEFFQMYKESIPAEVRQFLEVAAGKVRIVSADLIAGILKDAGGGLEVGMPFPRLRNLWHGSVKRGEEDTRPEVLLTQEMSDTALLWAARSNVLVKDISAYAVKEHMTNSALPFLRLPEDTLIVSGDWVFDMARQVGTIEKGRWKDGVSDHRKADYILRFVKDNLLDRHTSVLEVVKIA